MEMGRGEGEIEERERGSEAPRRQLSILCDGEQSKGKYCDEWRRRERGRRRERIKYREGERMTQRKREGEEEVTEELARGLSTCPPELGEAEVGGLEAKEGLFVSSQVSLQPLTIQSPVLEET